MTGTYAALQMQLPQTVLKHGLLAYSACTDTQRGPAGELRHIQIRSLHITTRALRLLQRVPLVTHYS